MDDAELKKRLISRFPNWNLSIRKSGVATWINLGDGNIFFNIQVTPSDGVGVSVINNNHAIDMSGHDEVFDDFETAVNYIEGVIPS